MGFWAWRGAVVAAAVLMAGLGAPGAWGQAAGVFETPVKTDMVTVWRDDPTTPNLALAKVKVTVACSLYAHVFVAVVRIEHVFGSYIFAIPAGRGRAVGCNDPAWSNPELTGDLAGELAGDGDLVGVRNDLVVSDGPDTLDYGTDFTIFRMTDHKVILSDFGYVGDKPGLDLISMKESKDGLRLRYGRVFVGPCSIAAQGEACIRKFTRETGIDAKYFGICAGRYWLEQQRLAKAFCARSGLLDQGCYKGALTPTAVKQFNADPTAIAYSVQLFIPADAPTVQLDYYSVPVSGREAQKRSGARFAVVGGLIDCSAAE